MKPLATKTECDRCGTCCSRGGPALHFEDKVLLRQNTLTLENLITIRKGEPVLSLDSQIPEPAADEIIKIKGKGSDWTCSLFDDKIGCTIYQERPLECFLLKCWDTAELESVAGKSLLHRSDLLAPGDPVQTFIQLQETRCPLDDVSRLITEVQTKKDPTQSLALLEDLVNTDMIIRSQAVERLRLSLDLELFYFGRPLFKILSQYQLTMHFRQQRFVLFRG